MKKIIIIIIILSAIGGLTYLYFNKEKKKVLSDGYIPTGDETELNSKGDVVNSITKKVVMTNKELLQNQSIQNLKRG